MYFSRVFLLPNYREGHQISWQILPTAPEGERSFFVQMTEDPGFSVFREVAVGDTFLYKFVEADTPYLSFDTFYYRVRMELNGEVDYSDVIRFNKTTLEGRKYMLSCEMIRIKLMHMRLSGTPCFLLKQKTLGPKNSNLIDVVSGVPMTNNFGDFGTGFVGGFYPPIPFYIQYEDKKQGVTISPSTNTTINAETSFATSVAFPGVQERDILYDIKQAKYMHISDAPYVKHFPGTTIPIIQGIGLETIPTSDPIYKTVLPNDF